MSSRNSPLKKEADLYNKYFATECDKYNTRSISMSRPGNKILNSV